jgi:hypothetical protein
MAFQSINLRKSCLLLSLKVNCVLSYKNMPFQKTTIHFKSRLKIREVSISSKVLKEFKFYPFLYKIIQFRLNNLYSI